MIEPQAMENGGLQIVHVNWIFRCLESQIVGFPDRDARADAAPCQPHREAVGVMITAGGLVFVAGGINQKLRALDIDSGKALWSPALPAGGQSTPMSYQLPDGKQFVVIAAGGHGDLPVTLGDYLVAYALP